MTIQEFIDSLKQNNFPMDAQLTLSEFGIFEHPNEKDGMTYIVDIPVVGYSYFEDSNEVRFYANVESTDNLEKIEKNFIDLDIYKKVGDEYVKLYPTRD
jgi:hypothetical protein